VPREGGPAIALTEKLEDVVSIIFIPLVSDSSRRLSSYFLICLRCGQYFTLSGLSTDLGLLNDGE
jgi:hypothetical protein